ncbi:GNAT family N-acetyltransferase [uncultured Shewanella sp.]|uniref:GNAT family N-acetyltransferase n=1 Tax=uncultured Shewanella sp. TaxID=173975 RepID=UPI002609AD63|nr:GNAT family N-acetyltransferase [uncultured Shewanella sp.]
MDIIFCPTDSIQKAALFTFENMRQYYQKIAPEWNTSKIVEVTKALESFDIKLGDEVIGVMRLEYKDTFCYLRDLQISANHQNKGFGKVALNEAKRKTLSANFNTLKLRVLKVSPAISLYERNGFVVESEDNRFLNMLVRVT